MTCECAQPVGGMGWFGAICAECALPLAERTGKALLDLPRCEHPVLKAEREEERQRRAAALDRARHAQRLRDEYAQRQRVIEQRRVEREQRRARVLAAVRDRGTVSAPELRSILGLSTHQVWDDLRALVALGEIRPTGHTKNRRYVPRSPLEGTGARARVGAGVGSGGAC